MLRLKNGVSIESLSKYGFNNPQEGVFIRCIDGNPIYAVGITQEDKYIQVAATDCFIAGSLQTLLFDMIMDGIVEKVETDE